MITRRGSIRARHSPSGNVLLESVHGPLGLIRPEGVVIERGDVDDVITALLALRECPREQAGPSSGATFPVELDEHEACLLDQLIREKFMPERVQQQIDTAAERLLHKVHRVLNRFRDERTANEEFAASLTNEEREIIRARRAQRDQDAIYQAVAAGPSPTGKP